MRPISTFLSRLSVSLEIGSTDAAVIGVAVTHGPHPQNASLGHVALKSTLPVSPGEAHDPEAAPSVQETTEVDKTKE